LLFPGSGGNPCIFWLLLRLLQWDRELDFDVSWLPHNISFESLKGISRVFYCPYVTVGIYDAVTSGNLVSFPLFLPLLVVGELVVLDVKSELVVRIGVIVFRLLLLRLLAGQRPQELLGRLGLRLVVLLNLWLRLRLVILLGFGLGLRLVVLLSSCLLLLVHHLLSLRLDLVDLLSGLGLVHGFGLREDVSLPPRLC